MSIETLAYPAKLTPQEGEREILVSFPDLPECLTEGADEAEALAEAADALEEAIANRIEHGEEIPEPSPRGRMAVVPVPPLMAAKVALYLAMAECGMSKTELARRLECDESEVRRMLNPRHATKVARLQAALAECGVRLETRMIIPSGMRLLGRPGRGSGPRVATARAIAR